jgi:nucleoside diphosphate kinase
MVLYGNNAVKTYRNAVEDIRSKYAINKTENAVHGADGWKRAHEEMCIFFDC